MSAIDFLTAYVILFLSNTKITFSQGGIADLPIGVLDSRTFGQLCLSKYMSNLKVPANDAPK